MTPWTVAHQAPMSMGFSRQEYWSGLPFLSPEDLPNPGIEHTFLTYPALADGFFTASATLHEAKRKLLSRVRPFATPQTIVQGILQARILEWVAFPF